MDSGWIKRATLQQLKRAGIESHILLFDALGTARAVGEGVLVVTEDWLVKKSDGHSKALDEILAEIAERESPLPTSAGRE